jgi:hypothetical protein
MYNSGMIEIILFILILFIIFNFTEYKAMSWGWKHGGLGGALKMMVAIIVRLFLGLFIKQ